MTLKRVSKLGRNCRELIDGRTIYGGESAGGLAAGELVEELEQEPHPCGLKSDTLLR
jgi:hypothetical protein